MKRAARQEEPEKKKYEMKILDRDLTIVNPNKIGSTVNFKAYDPNDAVIMNRTGGACWGGLGGHIEMFKQKARYEAFFLVSDTNFDEDSVERWMEFCRRCTFPVTYKGIVKTGEFDGKGREQEYYKVEIDSTQYLTGVHLFAGINAIRYISYYYQDYYYLIPDYAFKIRRALKGKCSCLQALILAHYASTNGFFDKGHGLFNNVTPLISIEQFTENVKKSNSVNGLFEHHVGDVEWETLYNLLRKGSYEEAFKLLKVKKDGNNKS